MKEITERTLKVENVSLGYGETTIVKDLSLEFPRGKVTAIIGPNGCANPPCYVASPDCSSRSTATSPLTANPPTNTP